MGAMVRSYDEKEEPLDKIFFNKPHTAIHLAPGGAREVPVWAEGARNFRGLVPPSRAHYMALVKLGNGVIEAIIDTGGARSLIDLDTARTLGLKIEMAKSNNMGNFWGPGGEVMGYTGTVRGPIKFHLTG